MHPTFDLIFEVKEALSSSSLESSEIAKRSEMRTNAIENAVFWLQTTNEELKTIKTQIEDQSLRKRRKMEKKLCSLMQKATSDGDGGVKQILKDFLSSDFVSDNPTDAPLVAKLTAVLQQQMTLFAQCLSQRTPLSPQRDGEEETPLSSSGLKLVELEKKMNEIQKLCPAFDPSHVPDLDHPLVSSSHVSAFVRAHPMFRSESPRPHKRRDPVPPS